MINGDWFFVEGSIND